MASSSTDHAQALGTAPMGRLLWSVCSQTTASVGIYGIYALTNAWFVARGVNEVALAAVNLVAPMLLILGAVSSTVGAGGAALVSLALGSRRVDRAQVAAGNAFAVFWIAAIAIMCAGLVFMDPLLNVLGAYGETREYARDYATILLMGSLVSTGFSAIVRAEGRIRFSMVLWVIPVIVQIVFDPLLIFGFDMGVQGAAWGTVAGQAVSAGMSVWFFFVQRDRPYQVGWSGLRLHWNTVSRIVSIGAPSFLSGLGATVLTILINQKFSSNAVVTAATALAAYAVCSRITTFVTMPQTGIAQGLAPIIGFNTGLGRPDRVALARTLALRATIIYGLALAVAVAGAAPFIAGLFVSDADTLRTAQDALRIVAVSFIFSGVAPAVSGYFQSRGRPAPSYLISVGTLLVIKIPLVVGLGSLGLTWLWWSLVAGEVAAAVVALVTLRLADTDTPHIDRSAIAAATEQP